MKPPAFRYRRPSSLHEALEALHADEDAKVLAGGQSLVPLLNFRLAQPSLLVDLGRLPGMRHIILEPGGLRIGALVTHDQFMRYPAPLPGYEDVREAMSQIGHLPIRTRGTVGGSLAHADAVAEWNLLGLLHDGEAVLASLAGRRTLPLHELIEAPLMSTIAPDEVLIELRLLRPLAHARLEEVSRRPGDFAIVATAVGFDVTDGVIADPRVVVAGVGGAPRRLDVAEAELAGRTPQVESFRRAGEAAADGVRPPSDSHGTATYRRHLVAALVQRAGEGASTAA